MNVLQVPLKELRPPPPTKDMLPKLQQLQLADRSVMRSCGVT